jgi:hypothetical protein
MSNLDFGELCAAQLRLVLDNALSVRGYDAEVYRAKVYDNEFKDMYPEYERELEKAGSCKIGLSQPIDGLAISDFIRLTDVTRETVVTTAFKLFPEDQLVVIAPDGKKLNLRITEAMMAHPLTSIAFKYKAVML